MWSPRRQAPLVALLALLLLGACAPGGGIPGGPTRTPPPPTAPGGANNPYALGRDLAQDPAAALQMPDADLLMGGGPVERRYALAKPLPATVVGIYGTQATPEEVRAWYDRELRAVGYTYIPNGAIHSTGETAVWLWCKGTVGDLRLGIKNPAVRTNPDLNGGRAYRTVFDATLIGLLPSEPCPTPP